MSDLPESPECLNAGKGDCAGAVEYRPSLSGTGLSIARCGGHWTQRLEQEQELKRRYPEQAPPDFDPMYAGERWNEDDPWP